MPWSTSSSTHGVSSRKRPTTGRTTTTGRPRTGRPTTTATSVAVQDIICAISESRGICPTVGLAFVNLSTSEAVLCQICDSQTYARTIQKLAVLDPSEILFMKTAQDPKSKLYAIVEENLPHLTITTIDRRYWAEKTGHECVEQLAFKEDLESIKISLEGNFFATCCLAAALSYIELEFSKTFACHSLRIKYEPSDGSVLIDLATIVSLELIQNLQNAKSKDCLFGVLNETLTPMGSRLLRSNILQPSTEPNKLCGRYNAVEELGTREDMFHAVREALKSFVDSDRVLTALTIIPTKITFEYSENSINNMIMLKTYVSSIRPIYEALTGAKCDLLVAIRNLCAPTQYEAIVSLLDSTLNTDVTYQSRPLDLRNQRTYAVKAGVNSLLDVARQTYKEANSDVNELARRLGDAHGLALDLRFEAARQYYFRLPISDLESRQLPSIFINIFRKKHFVEFQTLDLVKLNQKISDSHNEVLQMSDRSIQELIEDVRTEISVLFRISEGIAMLDILAAFAQLAAVRDYVRPELTDTLAIKAGRHPIQEKIHSNKFVPNDAYATQQSRFQIITGCNMSGKSTYIRSLALMAVMAQIGCFVPANYASFPITNQLFARISADDNVETNVSTFSAEMREMAFILRNIGPKSMVIVDELGRGTSTVDGLSIAIAISEALVDSHALVWFATHFHDLARVMAQRNGVVNLHLAVDMSDPMTKITMLYRIADGHVEDKHYGIAFARLLSLPGDLLETAEAVSKKVSLKSANQRRSSEAVAIASRRKLLLDLREQLLQAQQGELKGEELRKWLKTLQDEFTLRMAALDSEIAMAAKNKIVDSHEETEDNPSFCEQGDNDLMSMLSEEEATDITSPLLYGSPTIRRRAAQGELK
ncbi:MutS protein msh4 [Ophidiomyces ophidiicola]|uniref:MutS protein msh4 n=1 Tax=Ophidiomyces ophidiicola TaxID=1387563 RepID=A0ACB8UMQ4_9EURO|nr:MutS protein msh4 [Ophidiomyces ophidiicola]KAI1911266.1 MutS protein msh4 [Ophidiomyces ophidiicola]KAI1921379.1 MutS protein msh4 [Ophidiomyces ophidiicola]KAI1954216.1 MutS protein msh4 [Ophidiomyces ophidiicola]KAI2043801.1 MutS protein msh4 [Ophidiomyces ophidiicola]KAI2145058.1 MutS protein msh4 [Ophidiomyces ophidiicola]